MTRARDMANLGSQAGSGLDASDITSGVLPSGVTGGSGLTALGTVTAGNLANTAIVYPVGHVLQVKSTVVTDRNSSTEIDTSTIGTDCGLNVTITPQSSTSEFFLMLSVGVCGATSGNSLGFILSKDGSKIGNGVDSSLRNGVWTRGLKWVHDSNHASGASATYLDTVSGSAQRVYKAGLVIQDSGQTGYINMAPGNANASSIYGSYTSSSLTVFEIQG